VSAPSCGCRTDAVGIGFAEQSAAVPPRLSPPQRLARALAGLALMGLAAASQSRPRIVAAPISLLGGWVGLSHLVAAATAYNGCPELGAIPSLLAGRHVHTRCGPWQQLDDRFRLADTQAADQEASHHA
jgi:hypothetical protein